MIKKHLQNRMIKAFHDSEKFLKREVTRFGDSQKLRVLIYNRLIVISSIKNK